MREKSETHEADAAGEADEPTLTDGSTSDTPTPVDEPGKERPPSLFRHSPFVFGFFTTMGALLAFFLLRQLLSISGMLVLLVIAMFLAIGLHPLVDWLTRHKVKRGLAVFAVLIMVVGVFTLFVLTLAPVISDQITLITRNAPSWLNEMQHNPTVQRLDERFDVVDKAQAYLSSGNFSGIFGGVLGFGLKVLSAITNSLIVLVLTVYFLAALPSIKAAGYRLAPASRRPRVAELGDKVIASTGAYVSGAFLVAVCAGISTLIFTFIIGLGQYSFALAFIVGLLSLIPVIGSIISAILITLLGLTVSLGVGIACLVYFLAYQQVEQYFIYPKIMSRAVDLPATVTVVAALLGGSLLGITGALLAVPTAAALLLLHREVFLRRQDAR